MRDRKKKVIVVLPGALTPSSCNIVLFVQSKASVILSFIHDRYIYLIVFTVVTIWSGFKFHI